ncbi:hypothetical protein APE_1003.1 [Aeropyrum pernix K1]|uniref:Peptidase M28 domain-containing protein n=1 Tax=Aeropyrum pernix (strain ATCC 700893 / DSM 11879 / JCM 9820 / NBRC 100138 / K1) TaxID=272557 RepID=Q9YDB0_AERPE|nr:M28 family peptidase [Aeropyrum pernix]BAA79987.2 hypothetical protein APE_1003.1 [Aeropyrum pernix K1]
MAGGWGGLAGDALRLYSALKGASGWLGVRAGGSRGAVEVVRAFLEESLGVSSRLHEFWVDAWVLRSSGLDPAASWHSVGPYVLGGDVEGRPLVLEGDPSHASSWRGVDAGGRVVVARAPGVVDDLKAAALLAAEAGAEALLVESRDPRVIVTGGDWGYSVSAGSPTPIPVAVVPLGYSRRAEEAGVVRVWVDACVERRRDYNVVAVDGGRGGVVLAGAHLDHWYTGFTDNILGVAQAVETAGRLRGRGLAAGVVVFGAEEHGMPGMASWYWAAGSRSYAGLLRESGAAEEVEAYVNFDVAGYRCLVASGAPQLVGHALEAGAVERCCECPECDSIMMAWAGIPTLSLHSLWCPGVQEAYHTPRDTPDRASWDTAWTAVEAAVRTVTRGPEWPRLTHHFRSSLSGAGVRGRRLLYILESLARRAGWGALFREASRSLLKVVHYGSLRWESRPLEALYMPEASLFKRIMGDIERGRPPLAVVEVGRSERQLYSLSPTPPPRAPPRSILWEQLEANMERLEEEVEDLRMRLVR